MVAPVQPDKVRRARQNGAELGRRRILDLLEREGPCGVDYLVEQTRMSSRTMGQRLRELADLVVIRQDPRGFRMVGLRSR